jgi:hypothetical protein
VAVDATRLGELIWTAAGLILAAIVLITRRARRHGGAGRVGAVYEWLNEDKKKAADTIVEERTAARRPENPDEPPKPGD